MKAQKRKDRLNRRIAAWEKMESKKRLDGSHRRPGSLKK